MSGFHVAGRRRSASRAGVVALVAPLALFALFACSTFTATTPPDTAIDGGGGADDAGTSPEAGGDKDAATCGAVLASDPNHCGFCGHSCLGGACVAGRCQPVVIGTTTGEDVIDVAVDDQRVFWLTSTGVWSGPGHVYACPRSGCAELPPTSVTGAPVSTGTLAGDGTKAFFSIAYGGGVAGLRAILPSAAPQVIGNGHTEAVRLQVRSGMLYFVTLYEGATTGFTGHVYRWNGAKETLVASFDGPHNLNDMVVVGNRVFFAGAEYLGGCALTDPPTCTNPSDLRTGSEYFSLTTDGASLMWTDGQSVLSCAANDPKCETPTTLLGPPNLENANVVSVTVDHGSLYASTAANDIFTCSLPDCGQTVHKLVHESRLYRAVEFAFGHSVAADDTAVYWAAVDGTEVPDGDGGLDSSMLRHRIMKLAK